MTKEEKSQYNKEWHANHPYYHAAYAKEMRHRKGISKSYKGDGNRGKLTKEQRIFNQKISRRISNLKRRRNGIVSLKTVQLIYEQNIKKYGNLTCYLCLKHVLFGQDCIEHKIPLARGGNNDRDNLDIAHRACNEKKHINTEEEYRKKFQIV